MSVYSYNTKKDGKMYGARFIADGVKKNLRGFKTKKEAKAAEFDYQSKVEYREALRKKAEDEAAHMTFQELFDLYRMNYLSTLAPSTMYDYIKASERFLLPTFGELDIKALNRRNITAWQDGLSKELSSRYRQKIRTMLSSILIFAEQRDLIEKNPVESVVRIKRTEQKKEVMFWTKEEFDKFIDVVDDPLYHALFFFLYNTGCRKGEAFALRWSDIDFVNNTVSITKNYTKKGQIMAQATGKKIVEKTKNKKTGIITIPSSLTKELLKLKRGEYVFGGDDPLSENTVKRRLDFYIAKAGVKQIHVHCLRHSCAALMISTLGGGIDTLYAVAARLRDSVEQILKTYGHLFPSKHIEYTTNFNALFENK